MKNLGDVEVTGKYTEKKLLKTTNCDFKKNCELDTRKCGDWNESSRSFDKNSLLNSNYNNNKINNAEWKCKNLYSIPNLEPCNNLHSYGETPPSASCKIKLSGDSDTFVSDKEDYNLFEKLKHYLIDYQENVLGISSSEEYNFSALMKMMGQAMAKSLLALFYFIINVIPMALVCSFICII